MSSTDDSRSLERVRAIAAAVFDLPIDAIDSNASPNTLQAWDSLGHLNLMLAVEEETGFQLSPEETLRVTSIGDLAALLDEKGRVN